MGGKQSRSKGIRGELNLRDFLIKCDYTNVRRIPLSGSMAGFKGDVIGTLGKKDYVFELKCRANAFGSLYEAAEAAEVVCIIADNSEILCTLSTYPPINYIDIIQQASPAFSKRLRKMRDDWLKGEDVLVLKDDRKPFLFLEFVKPEKKKKAKRLKGSKVCRLK